MINYEEVLQDVFAFSEYHYYLQDFDGGKLKLQLLLKGREIGTPLVSDDGSLKKLVSALLILGIASLVNIKADNQTPHTVNPMSEKDRKEEIRLILEATEALTKNRNYNETTAKKSKGMEETT